MKLIWITPECPYPPNTGGRVGIWKRIEYFSNNNEIYLFSIIDNKNEELYKEEMSRYCKEIYFFSRLDKSKSIIQSIHYPFPAVSRWNNIMRKKLAESYERLSPDFIMVDFPQMMGVLPDSIINSGKIILNQHNIEFQTLRSLADGINNPVMKQVYKIVSRQMESYESALYKKNIVKLFTFVSNKDKEYFENKYKKYNTFLVPVGAEIVTYSNDFVKNHKIVFVAKMSYHPNAEGALWLITEIIPRIKQKVKDVELFLVGKDPSKELREAAEKEGNVVVTGTVDSVEPYYSESDIAVVPIMTGGGVNVKLLEALGKNKFVVTTSKGIEGTELIPNTHLLVSDDADIFAEYCINLLNDSNSYETMRYQAYKFMNENYSWKSIVGTFESKLRKMKDDI